MCIHLRKKYDYISVFHAYRDDQDGVPDQFKASVLKDKYEKELAQHMSPYFSEVKWAKRGGSRFSDTLQEAILSWKSSGNPAHFLVMGHMGRKGKGFY